MYIVKCSIYINHESFRFFQYVESELDSLYDILRPFWFCSRLGWLQYLQSLTGIRTQISLHWASKSPPPQPSPKPLPMRAVATAIDLIWFDNISPPSAHSSSSTVNLLCLKPFLGNWSWDTRHLAAESHWTCRQDFRKRNGSNLFNTVNTLSYKNTLT